MKITRTHSLCKLCLRPRPGERHVHAEKQCKQRALELLYLPYQYLSAVNVSISYRCERVGLPAQWREREGEREEALTPQNDKATREQGARSGIAVLALLCCPALHSPPTILIFSLNFRSLGSHRIEARDYHHRLRDGYCRKAARRLGPFAPPHSPASPQMWS